MKVVVLNPPSKVNKNVMRDVIYGCWCKGRRVGGLKLPPIALLYVATVLKEDGCDTTFIDAGLAGVSYEDALNACVDSDMVVISTSTHTFNEDKEILRDIKKKNPSVLNVVYGPRPTFLSESVLMEESIDVVVRFEPEYIIRDIARKLENKESWEDVKGIGFLKGEKVVMNEKYPFIENLDELPFPDRHLLPKDVDYFNPVAKRNPMTTMLTSRGCPAKCTFCLSPTFFGEGVRFRSAENVLRELKLIVKEGYKEIFFRDETFTAFKERNKEICREIIKQKIDITWVCNGRVGMIDKETMILMREAGCHTIKFGIESGSQEILNRIKKGLDIEKAKETFRELNEVGMRSHAHFMVGHPGEGEEDVRHSIELAKELCPTTVTFGIMTPYPGTPLFDDLATEHPHIGNPDYSDFSKDDSGYLASLQSNMTAKQIESFVKEAYRSFYLRPSYIFGWLRKIKSADELKQLILAGTQVLEFSFKGDKN